MGLDIELNLRSHKDKNMNLTVVYFKNFKELEDYAFLHFDVQRSDTLRAGAVTPHDIKVLIQHLDVVVKVLSTKTRHELAYYEEMEGYPQEWEPILYGHDFNPIYSTSFDIAGKILRLHHALFTLVFMLDDPNNKDLYVEYRSSW